MIKTLTESSKFFPGYLAADGHRNVDQRGGGVHASQAVGGVEAVPDVLHPTPGQEAAAQVSQKLVVEGGVDERVVTCRAHGEQVARHLDDIHVVLAQDGEVTV